MITAVRSSATSAEQEGALPTFAEAVERHKAMLYSILWHFLCDRSLAEELAQEVFLELHQSWKSVKSPRHLVFWLRRVTAHRAIDLVRKRKIRPETSLEESGEPTVLEQVHDSFLASYLGRMVASLPEDKFSQLTDTVVSHEWKPMLRIRSGNNESTNVYAQQRGRDLHLLITSLDGREATLVQVQMRPAELIRFIDGRPRREH